MGATWLTVLTNTMGVNTGQKEENSHLNTTQKNTHALIFPAIIVRDIQYPKAL